MISAHVDELTTVAGELSYTARYIESFDDVRETEFNLKQRRVRMTNRDYVKTQIDNLPESAVEKVIEFISFQRYSLGLFDNDDEYLASIPGMTESIQEGLATPLSECVPLSKVWPDV